MFGIYRWFLSLMVAYSHLGPNASHAVGYYAVFGFFTLSGFLMAKILSETYLPKPHGLRRYLLNRFLRIYPIYWLVLLLAILLRIALDLPLPETIAQWISNAILFGLILPHGVRSEHIIIGPAWSLSTEFIFYLLIPLFMRNRFMFGWWVGFSILFAGAFYIDNQNLLIRYFSLIGASMPFAVGAALYLFRRHLPTIPPMSGGVLLGLGLVFYFFPTTFFISPADEARFFHQAEPSLYIMFILNALVIHFLSRIDIALLSRRLISIDHFAGKLSYPIFLVHGTLALAVSFFLPEFQPTTMALFLASLLPIHLIAWLLHRYFERPIERLRSAIKT